MTALQAKNGPLVNVTLPYTVEPTSFTVVPKSSGYCFAFDEHSGALYEAWPNVTIDNRRVVIGIALTVIPEIRESKNQFDPIEKKVYAQLSVRKSVLNRRNDRLRS